MRAFVLAGGFATRLWPLTEKRAKPLLPLAGKPLLTWLIEKIPEGVPVTVSTNAVFAKDFGEWKKAVSCQLSAVSILIEDAGHEDEKLGALGAVAKWIKGEHIEDDVLLLAGDNYFDFPLEGFLEEFQRHPSLVAFDIKDREQAKKFGVILPEKIEHHSRQRNRGRVSGFEEKPMEPASTLVSTGVILLPREILPILLTFAEGHPDHIGGIFQHLIHERGRVVDYVVFPTSQWFDIGSFETYLEATRTVVGDTILKLRNHSVPSPEENFQYTSILKTAADGPEATREDGNMFTGSVVLGRGSKVRKSTLHNVVLFEDCEIEDCVLEDCIIDHGCTLKGVDLTGKMLRAGTTLIRPPWKSLALGRIR